MAGNGIGLRDRSDCSPDKYAAGPRVRQTESRELEEETAIVDCGGVRARGSGGRHCEV